MIQTVKVNSDSTFEVNFGSFAAVSDLSDQDLPAPFIEKLQNIYDILLATGGSEIHSERGPFNSFEHIRKGPDILENSFGTTVTTEDFDFLVSKESEVDLALNPVAPEPETPPE